MKNCHYLLGGVKYVYIRTPNLFLPSMFHHCWQENTQINFFFCLVNYRQLYVFITFHLLFTKNSLLRAKAMDVIPHIAM